MQNNSREHLPFRARKVSKRKTIFLEIVVFLFSLGIVAGSVVLIWISSFTLPDFSTIATRQLESTTKIYDRTGNVLLFAFREKIRRTPVIATDISQNIVKATIAIEDDQFYQHSGISLRGIARAFYVNFTSDKVQGGSTITQQVVKNALLTQDREGLAGIERKIKEVILAVKVEQTLSKDQILLMYLNDNPYGGEIYGVEEASLYYFNKHAKDLNLTEAAYLAAIPKNPPLYSPYIGKMDKLEERKNLVLQRMLDTGAITQKEYDEAKQVKVEFVKKEDNASKAHHFVFYVRDYLEKQYGADFLTQGLSVRTTLDYDIQKEIQDIAKKYIADYIKSGERITRGVDNAKLNTGVVVLDTETGQVIAMIGSRDYNDPNIDGKYNIATALRQPGSSIKPIVYAQAFENGFDPETYVFDTPTEFNTTCPPADGNHREPPCYSPQNYDAAFYGPMTMREALGNSRNIPAVKVLYLVGVNNVVSFAKKLGITSLTDPKRYGLSLVLGGAEVSLLQLTAAYLPFEQGGIYKKPSVILEIKDKNGKTLENYEDTGYQVMSADTAGKITSILSDNSARSRVFGVNNKMNFPGRDVAVKTGTTNDYKDGWVIGYNTDYVVGAWIGKNDNTQIGQVTASLSIVPMWNQIMTYLMNHKAPGILNKEYTRNPEVDGPNCDQNGFARDIIFTAITLGTFGLSASDPQIPHWYYGPSEACGTSESNLDPNATQNPNEIMAPMGVVNIGAPNSNNQPTGITIPPNNQ
jgi:1A family penicillin-binding protein